MYGAAGDQSGVGGQYHFHSAPPDSQQTLGGADFSKRPGTPPEERLEKLRRKDGSLKNDPRERLCCHCIPLRFGIFICAFLTLGYGLVSCIGLFTDGVNVLVGGYAEKTQLVVAWTGLLGVAGGWWGIVGCYDNNKSSLNFFWWYCLFRTTVGTLIFCVDMVTLYNCERFGHSLNSLMYHNYTMDRINRAGDCSYYRTLYICGWIIDVLCGCYTIFVTHVYLGILEEREPDEFSIIYERRRRTLPRWFVSETAAEHEPKNTAPPRDDRSATDQSDDEDQEKGKQK